MRVVAIVIFAIAIIGTTAKAQYQADTEMLTDTAWVTLSQDSTARAWQVANLPFDNGTHRHYVIRSRFVEVMPTVGEKPTGRYGIDRTADGRIDIVTNSEEECMEATQETRDCVEVGESIIFNHNGDSYERVIKNKKQ